MKKLIYLFFVVFMVPTIVLAKNYDIDSQKMHIDFNDDWTVFTRENLENNEYLDDFNVTYDYINRLFYDNDIFIDAIYQDRSLELFLRVKSVQDVDNISGYNDEKLNNLASALGKKVKASKYYVFKNDYNYIVTEYKDSDYNILSYYTIVEGKGYTFTVQTKSNITESNKKQLKDIISTVKFDVKVIKNEKINYKLIAEILVLAVVILIIILKIMKRNNQKKGLQEL